MSRFVIVSFYTEGTLYEKEIQNLIESCKRFELQTDIIGVPNLKDWNANCHFKPPFILDRLKTHKCPIVWLDADAVIQHYPTLFDTTEEDFMVRMRDDVDFNHFDKVISSTIYANYTPLALQILEAWVKESQSNYMTLCDQECLKNVLKCYSTPSIPIPYCRIDGLDTLPVEESVICQYQASRLLKKVIDEEVIEFDFIEKLDPKEFQKARFSNE